MITRKALAPRANRATWLQKNTGKIIAFAFLLVLAAVWLMPIVWAVLSSFKPSMEAKQYLKLKNILPIKWTPENYQYVLGTATTPILQWMRNSFVVSIAQTMIVLFITSTSAFAYERLQFRGKEAIFWVVFGLSMFPNVIGLVPQFQIMNALRWLDKLPSVIFPGVTGVFNIFLIRNFLKSVPRDLDEAASIDGAGPWRIYYQIILPSIIPVLTVVGLFAFTGAWNDFVWPSIALTNPKNLTLTPGLKLLQVSEGGHGGGGHVVRQLAGGVIGIIPTFLIYLGAQQYFLTGLNLSAGIKG
ncbi:carbohydrate ABC transporter permease [Bacillota bacterium Meth-B3]|nr:carbohydrate ABC transporter permease [Christensenellaceae bacterium]